MELELGLFVLNSILHGNQPWKRVANHNVTIFVSAIWKCESRSRTISNQTVIITVKVNHSLRSVMSPM